MFSVDKKYFVMFRKLIFLAFIVIFCDVNEISAQTCIPDPVVYVGLASNAELSWTASENCADTQCLIRIHTGGLLEYQYITDELSLDISFLNYCISYNFTVSPLASNVLGPETFLHAAIALPEDIDIAILGFSTSPVDDNILMQWHVEGNYSNCVTYYLVNIWTEDDEETLYVRQNGYLLEHAPFCMNYSFEVTAYYYKWVGTTGRYNYTFPGATNPPSLVYLRRDTTTINTTWALEKYSINRCNVTNLYVRSARFNLTIPIQDVPERPTVDVSIPGLRADSMYYFNVSVENTAGLSAPFQIAVQTLPVSSQFDLDVSEDFLNKNDLIV